MTNDKPKKFRVTFWPSIDIEAQDIATVEGVLEKMGIKHNLKVLYGSSLAIKGIKEVPMNLMPVKIHQVTDELDTKWFAMEEEEEEEDGQVQPEPGEGSTTH